MFPQKLLSLKSAIIVFLCVALTWEIIQIIHTFRSSRKNKKGHKRLPTSHKSIPYICSTVRNINQCESFGDRTCFDISGCQAPTFYVYDRFCSNNKSSEIVDPETGDIKFAKYWRDRIESMGLLANNPREACFKLSLPRAHQFAHPCIPNTPNWNDGTNHVFINFGDWPACEFNGVNGNTILVSGFMLGCYYRPSYDISFPLTPRKHLHEYSSLGPFQRKYWLTFQGTVYFEERGKSRWKLLELDKWEGHNIVIDLICRKEKREELECIETQAKHNALTQSYESLMNTTFGLVPEGRQPATYRLGEVMSAGAIPVFFCDDYIKPFSDQISWDELSFTFSTDQVNKIVPTLESIDLDKLAEMQVKVLEIYDKYLKSEDIIADNVIRTLIDRVPKT